MGCLRTLARSALPVLCLTIWLPGSWAFYFLQWGPDLAGPWCSRRPRGQDCCVGRNDYCAVPILGTECYCDIFCNATAYDCCPDYWGHCHGVARDPPTTTLPPPRSHTAYPASSTGNQEGRHPWTDNSDGRPVVLPITSVSETTNRVEQTMYATCVTHGKCKQFYLFEGEIVQACVHQNRGYRPGAKIKENCNECTCVEVGSRYDWRCSNDVCLVRPELITAVNDGPYTWRSSNYSFLWGLTLDEGIRYRLGTYPLEQDVLEMTPLRVRQEEVLPERFDARVRWPGLIAPISDQGNCASSWAFSTVAVASDRLSIESEGAIVEVLSAQHMLSCDTNHQDGCTGGHVDRAWWYLRRHGVVTEACYPYLSGSTSVQGECQIGARQRGGDCPSGIQYKLEKRYKASPPYRYDHWIMVPVQAIFEVKEDFYTYKSGVYQYTNLALRDPPAARKSAFHSVRIVGWGVERTPARDIIKYWICANSWGPEWGENGYFRIVRGVNANQIESYIVGAWGRITGDVLQRQLLESNRRRRLGLQDADVRRLRELSPRGRRRGSIKKQLRNLESPDQSGKSRDAGHRAGRTE
ncbi:uncharacterized peptidase C1-like protein F26E4.3 [Pomacea canaliculata]|uniref:uncharacterized peptidase C1-like protein F26E4.3 n=1 Tax=Pomacea canaliculata TaxID=400727 RepID=UPI000D732D29|nr:uncharacterized peptidase C1-like protein F26E4.3 [Pomacea canaliculata]